MTEYNPDWSRLFEKEAAFLNKTFQPYPIQLHHIGSTSVEGMRAKPIIDIMGEVEDLDQVDNQVFQLEKNGYDDRGEHGIKGRRYFVKKAGLEHKVHLHIFQAGADDVLRHIAFRDFLITHPDIAEFYGSLKQDLAEAYPEDIESYIEGKNAAVLKIEEEALNWWYSES